MLAALRKHFEAYFLAKLFERKASEAELFKGRLILYAMVTLGPLLAVHIVLQLRYFQQSWAMLGGVLAALSGLIMGPFIVRWSGSLSLAGVTKVTCYVGAIAAIAPHDFGPLSTALMFSNITVLLAFMLLPPKWAVVPTAAIFMVQIWASRLPLPEAVDLQVWSGMYRTDLLVTTMTVTLLSFGIYLASQVHRRELQQRDELLAYRQKQLATSAHLHVLAEMSASIAHEVNNPLMIISATANEILKHPTFRASHSPELERHAKLMAATATRIAHVVKGMLQLSHRDQDAHFQPTNLHELVQDVATLCKSRLLTHGVTLTTDIPINIVLRASSVQIGQVLINLIQNADDAMELSAAKEIRIQAKRVRRHVELLIADTGPGIPAELRQQVLEPFFTTKGPEKGTGLGLSVSRRIIEKHGGTLQIADTRIGCTFVITLPFEQTRKKVA